MEDAGPTASISDAPERAPLGEDEILLRRVPREFRVADGGTRPNSNAFDDSPDGSAMSVYVESLLDSIGKTDLDVIRGYDGYALVAFTVGMVRDLGWEVRLGGADPIDTLGAAHAGVHGQKTKAKRRTLAQACEKRVWP